MKPFYKSPLARRKKANPPKPLPKDEHEVPLGELTLLEQDSQGCDPYNNTGKLEVKKSANAWPNTPK